MNPDHCGKCLETKRECKCKICVNCEGDIISSVFKKKKYFCSRCNVSICGKCIVDQMCKTCQSEKDSNDERWKNACDLDFFMAERAKDEKLEEMIGIIKESSSVTRLKNLLQCSDKEYLKRGDLTGKTLLFHAVTAGDMDMMNYLISEGSDIHQTDNRGGTLLHQLASETSATAQVKGQMLRSLIASGVSTFKLNNTQDTALDITKSRGSLDLQDLLEKAMYKESYHVLTKFVESKPDIADDVTVCLKYIGSKIKCLNPFEKKSKLKRNKSLNYRSFKEKETTAFNEGVDPYKLKKTVTDNNDKLTHLTTDMSSLRYELLQATSLHQEEITKLKTQMLDMIEEKDTEISQQRDLYNNQLDILQCKLDEAKKLEEAAVKELEDLLALNRRYKLCWVPKSVTEKCADVQCPRVFRDNYSQHHCRCCGRVFCYDCSLQRRAVPFYGYLEPVRVCRYCYDLLEEEVLCDFDSEDLDEQQWASVHNQSEANTHNLGKKSMSIFNFSRSRSTTLTSGYRTENTVPEARSPSLVLSGLTQTFSDLDQTSSVSEASSPITDPYSGSESTLSNHSDGDSSTSVSETSIRNWKTLRSSVVFSKSKQNIQKLLFYSKDSLKGLNL